MGDFNTPLPFVLKWEGGYSNHSQDRGGETKYGITNNTFNKAKEQGIIDSSLATVRDLSLQDAKNIYEIEYWNKINGNALPSDLSVAVFDTAVNMGVTASVKMLQDILGVSQDGIVGPQTLSAIENYNGNLVSDLLNARETRYMEIAEKDQRQNAFLKGWLNRVNDLRDFVATINGSIPSSGFHYIPCVGFVTDEIYKLFKNAGRLGNAFIGSPVILDLDGDGVETMGVKDGAYFDHDGNGFAEQTGWTSSDDGLLVMDKNGDGVIDSGKELFGDQTLLQDGQKAANGFQSLAELDGNSDGMIDSNDAAYAQLKIWQDLDGDGYASADEIKTLSELGIASINTGYATSTFVDINGNGHQQVGSFTKTDNTTGTATDVWFKMDKMNTIAEEWLDVPYDISSLPDLQGYRGIRNYKKLSFNYVNALLRVMTILFIVFLNVTIVFAKEPYTNKSEILCNDVKVQIQTTCFSGNDLPFPPNGPYPYCTSQKIFFTNIKTGEIFSKITSGELVNDASPDKLVFIRPLDGLASGYACVKGNSDSYVLIEYYNGGNCEACEWHEIYTLRGEKLANSRHGKGFRGGKYEHFKDTYKRLGLPKTWPRSSFVGINLRQGDK
jgi:lysozyme family protein